MKMLFLRVLLLAVSPCLLAHAQEDPEATPSPTPATTWPRSFANDNIAISVYQPQVLSWKDNLITTRVAVSALSAGVAAPVFGTITLSARTEVDKEAGVVGFADLHITETNFPTTASEAGSYADLIITQTRRWSQNISLARLTANLAVTHAESAIATPDLQNTPPRIIFSSVPAALVLVDGDPALRPTYRSSLQRVINTFALLILDQSSGDYYLRLAEWAWSPSNMWATASTLDGPWTEAANSPPGFVTSPDWKIQPFKPHEPSSAPPAIPAIFVSTTPAELIVTDGPPAFDPVPGTQLLAVKNSTSALFQDATNQNYFVLISGRWFTSNSLQGPWQFVPSTQLTADFKNISGSALSAVAGTPQANEAIIANSIPQTATVKRTVTLEVKYDGDPQFKPITGTELKYGFNTPTPVIEVSHDEYYAVENGVWFTGPSALGPWAVAPIIPDVIYTIPASCPIYYATHVYVYGYTPAVVYVGYTPGYFGSYIAPDGVVVHGTGYVYPPYLGTSAWYGPPATYGRGDWEKYNTTNIYKHWDDNVVTNSQHTTVNHVANLATTISRDTLEHDNAMLKDNNVFAGSDGHPYKADTKSNAWQTRDSSGWKNASKLDEQTKQDLDNQRYARNLGTIRETQ